MYLAFDVIAAVLYSVCMQSSVAVFHLYNMTLRNIKHTVEVIVFHYNDTPVEVIVFTLHSHCV